MIHLSVGDLCEKPDREGSELERGARRLRYYRNLNSLSPLTATRLSGQACKNIIVSPLNGHIAEWPSGYLAIDITIVVNVGR